MREKNILISFVIFCNLLTFPMYGENYDFSNASLIVSENIAPAFRRTIVDIFQEETYRLAQIHLPQSEQWTDSNIALSLVDETSLHGEPFPSGVELPTENESYTVMLDGGNGRETVWLIAKDERGLLYAVGHLLRTMRFEFKTITFNSANAICSAPACSIRGHQLGYRNTANSYDGWNPAQYDRYIR